MALIPSFVRRPSAILRIPDAITRGLTPSAFIRELKGMGLSYRKTLMLSDWHNVSGTEARKDRFKYVRRDRRPAMQELADVDWDMSQEYMYKARAWTRAVEGEPLEERFVNIMSDRPMSPKEVEEEIGERWADREKYGRDVLERIQVVAGWHRIESDYPED